MRTDLPDIQKKDESCLQTSTVHCSGWAGASQSDQKGLFGKSATEGDGLHSGPGRPTKTGLKFMFEHLDLDSSV